MNLDIIIPCYNEENNIKPLYNKIKKELNDLNYQIIFINDGSIDNTYNILKELYQENKTNIKVINFSRNFGKDAAIYAGMKHSKSNYCTIIEYWWLHMYYWFIFTAKSKIYKRNVCLSKK